jgi:hypothetical protein
MRRQNPQGEGLEQGLAKLENSLIDRWFGKLVRGI